MILNEKDCIVEAPIVIYRVNEVPNVIEKIVEVPVYQTRENIKYVEKIVEKPVVHDIIIEKRVEVIKEVVIEVPVEKIIEVPVKIYIDVPVIKENIVEEEVLVETDVFDLEYLEEGEGQEEERDDEWFN